jgi:hypothetical protein
METGSTLIGLAMIVLCTLPFIFLNRSRKKREKQMTMSLEDIARQHHCNITRKDLLSDSVIGMDERKHFVFFYKKTKEKELQQSVNLADIKKCRVMNVNRPLGGSDSNQKVTDRLYLSFTPAEMKKEDVKFELYNSEVNVQLSGELQAAEEWSNLINMHLKN